MNSRSAHIVSVLLKEGEASLERLSRVLGISARLVRYELDGLELFCRAHGLEPPERGKSAVRLASREQAVLVARAIDALDPVDLALTPIERRDVEFMMLLSVGSAHTTSQEMANELGVSRSIVDRDVSLLRSELAASGIELESLSSKGRRLSGSEFAVRRHAVQVIERNLDFACVHDADAFMWSAVARWLKKWGVIDSARRLLGIVMGLESGDFGHWLAFDSLRMIVYTLAVMRLRASAPPVESSQIPDLASVVSSREYVYAVQIAEEMARAGADRLPPGEIGYLATILLGARFVTPEPYLREDWIDVQMMIDRVVRAMEERLGEDFSADQELIGALQNHLGPMVFRLRHGIVTLSPDVGEARAAHPDCFVALEEIVSREAASDGLLGEVSEGDVAYLALYFCASIERMARRAAPGRTDDELLEKVMAAIQRHCTILDPEGLLGDIERAFSAHGLVVRADRIQPSLLDLLRGGQDRLPRARRGPGGPPCERHALRWWRPSDVEGAFVNVALADMCRSGTAFVFMPGVALVHGKAGQHVNRLAMTLVTLEDGVAFGHAGYDPVRVVICLAAADNWSHIRALRDLLELFDRVDAQDLVRGDKRSGDQGNRGRCMRGMSIGSYIDAGAIALGRDAKTWEEAVRLAGDLLVRGGVCAPSYVQDMVDTVRELGPYIVVTPGVALAHARPKGSVARNGIAIATFPDGVAFGNADNDPCTSSLPSRRSPTRSTSRSFRRWRRFWGSRATSRFSPTRGASRTCRQS